MYPSIFKTYITTVILMAGFIVTASAESPANVSGHDKLQLVIDQVQNYLHQTSQVNTVANGDLNNIMQGYPTPQPVYSEIPTVTSTGAYIGDMAWSWRNDEVFRDGAWIVQYYGRRISIKLGFVKGVSETGASTLLPVARLSDITNINYMDVGEWSYALVGKSGCYATSSTTFHFEFTSKSLTVAKCANGQPDYSFKQTVTYQQWADAWSQDAAKYCGKPFKDHCFIVQGLRQSASTVKFGYVASRGKPLTANGLPEDFIELFSHTSSGQVYLPSVDSIPLKLTFKLGPQAWPTWQIYTMTRQELSNVQHASKAVEHGGSAGDEQAMPFPVNSSMSYGDWSRP